MAFTTNLTGTAQVDDSIIEAMDASFLLASGQQNVMEQFVEMKFDVGGKSIELPRYARAPQATTPLTETEDVVSAALADTSIIVTPAEYGLAVTKTKLASLQTGGKIDLAAAQVVGINYGSTMNKLACLALDAGTSILTPGGAAVASLVAGDIMSGTVLNQAYNKLARASISGIAGTAYVLIAHDDVIHDLRESTGVGSWQDVTKYATPEETLMNEVGMYKGFRVIRNNDCTVDADAGAGAVDVYSSYALGFNALGKGVSQAGGMVATGPFDKLNRFVNLGWYEVSKYAIVEAEALWTIKTASSVGSNV